MPKPTKIERHGLEDRAIALFTEGRSEAVIAEILTAELDGRDTISESAVHRYLVNIRKARQDYAHEAVKNHLNKHIDSDLEVLEELQTHWRAKMFAADSAGNLVTSMRDQINCSIRIENIIQIKAKQAVELNTGKKLTEEDHPVDLNRYRGAKTKGVANA